MGLPLNVRVSDIVSAIYPNQTYTRSYEKNFQNSIMTLGSEIHRHIQRNLKKSNKFLSIEHNGVYHLPDFNVNYHIDAFDPVQRAIYEIKSKYQFDNNFDKVRTQAQIYAYLNNASKIYYLIYNINYDIVEEEADYVFAKNQLKKGLDLIRSNPYYQMTQGSALDNSDFRLTSAELKEIFDQMLKMKSVEEIQQYILDLYQKLI